jgi:dTDP-glucose pyrophosphorylase
MVVTSTDSEARLRQVVVSPRISISEAIPILDHAGLGVLLLCEDGRKLVGILTDGDIRRAILRSVSFEEPCISIASRAPVVAPPQTSPVEALHIMEHGRKGGANHLPLVDREGRVVALLLRSDLITEDQIALSAVIMAGGFGIRLRPMTEELPKPMLPVGGRPLMELIIEQLRQAGIRRVNISTHYRPEKIVNHFGDGRAFGVELNYVTEDHPLGTAGALGLIEARDEPLLVINGDILTRVDFRAMLAYHREHRADLTVAVRQYDLQVPYGVLECEGARVRQMREKPRYSFLVNAGIYLLEPAVCHYIPGGQRFDMTDLIQRLLDGGRPVASFPIVEYWLDIGQPVDYEQAQEDLQSGRI